MIEQGKVIEIKDKNAIVEIDKKDECSKCGMCLFPKGAKSITFEAENDIDAKVNDIVIVERGEKAKFLGIILVFLVPLLLIGLSVFFAYVVIKKEIWMLFLSLIFIVAWYTILAVLDRKLKNKQGFKAKINSIVLKEKENKNE